MGVPLLPLKQFWCWPYRQWLYASSLQCAAYIGPSCTALLQAMASIPSSALCWQVVSQAPQHLVFSETQTNCVSRFSHQPVCSATRFPWFQHWTVDSHGSLKMDVGHCRACQCALPIPLFTLYSKLVDSVKEWWHVRPDCHLSKPCSGERVWLFSRALIAVIQIRCVTVSRALIAVIQIRCVTVSRALIAVTQTRYVTVFPCIDWCNTDQMCHCFPVHWSL